jgi:predicted MFS family arabinose efflux permease
VLVLVAIYFTHMVDFVIIMPLGGRLMDELKIGTEAFGYIIAAYAFAAGLASLAASLVLDRFDRKSVLLAMYAGFALSTLFCGLAWSYGSLLVARVLAGVFGGLSAVTIMTMVGDLFPPEKRGRVTGAITSAFAVASIAGLPLGLVLAEWAGWGMPFVVLGGLSGVVWAVAAVRLPPVRGHITAERRTLAEFRAVASNRNNQRAFAFCFFLVLGTFTVASFLAPYLRALNGWGEAELAWVYFAGGLFTLVGMQVVGHLADRLPRLPLFRVLGTAALVMGLVVTNLPQTPLWVAALALSAFMVCASGRIVPAQAMMLGVPEPRHRGAFMSLNTAVQHLGTAAAPVLAGWMITKTDGGKLEGYPWVGVAGAVAAVVALVLAGTLRTAPVSAAVAATPPVPNPGPEPQPEVEPEREQEPKRVAV